jgi:hypothetical protein
MVQKRTPFFGKHMHFLFGMVQKTMPFLRERERGRRRESGFMDYAIIFKFKMSNKEYREQRNEKKTVWMENCSCEKLIIDEK